MSNEEPKLDKRPEEDDWTHGKIYDEDGYCSACGNGRWKAHDPDCEIADVIDERDALRSQLAEVKELTSLFVRYVADDHDPKYAEGCEACAALVRWEQLIKELTNE